MNKDTLQRIEKESCSQMNVYSNRDIHGKLIEQFEKDCNGEWQDVTAIRQAEEHYIEVARRAGVPEKEIIKAVNEARERRNGNTT